LYFQRNSFFNTHIDKNYSQIDSKQLFDLFFSFFILVGLEQGRTAALGLINCVKGLANPENYYESYIAMANLNLDHSLAETSAALGEGYIRIFPEYGG